MSFYYQRAAAECAVRFLDGVRSVENHIVVEPPVLAHEVRLRIAEAMMRSAADKATQIAVQAVGGTVILQGVVNSRGERDIAERAAWTVEGVRSVIDNLIISA
jgi:osmotically-inducible protein OsmY